jgi:uncharacterized protein
MSPEPVPTRERNSALDVLRGAAILGILVVNIQSFSMIAAAYFNPHAHGDLAGANAWVWRLTRLLFDLKFLAIFSMLFGASIVMMGRRAGAGAYYRRIGVLLLIGLAHAYLVWYGDILTFYAVLGLLLYLLRNLHAGWLIAIGLGLLSIGSAITILGGLSIPFWTEAHVAAFEADMHPPAEIVQAEVDTYRGGWPAQMEHRAPEAFGFHTVVFLFWGVWRIGGLMLIGMGLFKLGIFTAERSRRFYAILIAAALLVGLPLVGIGTVRTETTTSFAHAFFFDAQFNYWGSLPVALGWIGLVMLLHRRLGLLAAVGRTALSNYLLQSILCTLIFYGHGLGLFGSVERVGQVAIVAGVWIVQIVLSNLWLRRFRFGPAEWLWRSATYRRWQPMRPVS